MKVTLVDPFPFPFLFPFLLRVFPLPDTRVLFLRTAKAHDEHTEHQDDRFFPRLPALNRCVALDS